jgi:hypothetical protein
VTKKATTVESSFHALSSSPRYRLVCRSWGKEKGGKNHFGLTAPGPIYGLYFDPGGIEGMVEKFFKAPLGPKEIHQVQYRFNKKRNQQEDAIEIKERFIADYEFALNNARTIQIDETELWELCRFAEWGRESARGREYGPLNGEYRGWIQDAYDAGVNLQLIQKVKEKWENDKPTGEMEPHGFKQAGNIVQVNLEHSWSQERGFVVKVVNCRQNMELAGEEYEGLDFPTLAQLVFPESSDGDWQ